MVNDSRVRVYAGGPGLYNIVAATSPTTKTPTPIPTTIPGQSRAFAAWIIPEKDSGLLGTVRPIAFRNPSRSSGLKSAVFPPATTTALLRSVKYQRHAPNLDVR